ncbi:PLPL2 protein, partial [Atractosteus spatula]|nr:PLPL2 protein [Atractosteus spatula]
MSGLEGGWNISFAGCGFLGVYHIGVASCLLEVAPHLIRDANKIYGASAGALTAAAIVSRACLAQCCEDVMEVAKEARKRNLGPLHPSFNMVKILRSGLHRALPHDAHLLASGRLCVSLTRVSDGQNVLVSDFSSKEELIQALICSCFVPIYCGLIPPLFRGVVSVGPLVMERMDPCAHISAWWRSWFPLPPMLAPQGAVRKSAHRTASPTEAGRTGGSRAVWLTLCGLGHCWEPGSTWLGSVRVSGLQRRWRKNCREEPLCMHTVFVCLRYVDGGISNNLPQYELKNTITISPFSGESDICPRDNSTNFHELRVTNTSIQFSLDNLYRLTRALFPPEPKILAEMCQSGYKDALRFLKENIWLLCMNCLTRPPLASAGPPAVQPKHPKATCCPGQRGGRDGTPAPRPEEEPAGRRLLRRLWLLRQEPWRLDERFIDSLPPTLRKVFFEACEERKGLYAQLTSLLPVRVASYVLMPYTLPVESAYSVALRLVEWLPELSDDVRWMCHLAGSVYRRAWGRAAPDAPSRAPLRKCMSLPPAMETQRPGLGLRGNAHMSSAELEAWYWGLPGSPLPPAETPRVRFFDSSEDSESEASVADELEPEL